MSKVNSIVKIDRDSLDLTNPRNWKTKIEYRKGYSIARYCDRIGLSGCWYLPFLRNIEYSFNSDSIYRIERIKRINEKNRQELYNHIIPIAIGII